MDRFSRRLARLGFGLVALIAGTAQAQVVISQVYGGGGNSGAPYRSDFIELHNTGTQAVSLSGWSVQYTSAAGSTWQRTDLSGSIAPGGYYLVKQADGANTAAAPLPTPDATGTLAMSGTTGKVALSDRAVTLAGACPTGTVDFLGFGSANCAEGGQDAAAPGLSNSTAAIRIDDCVDTDNNKADFRAAAPAPRNSAATPRACGNTRVLANVADAAVIEGNAGARELVFNVALTNPAGAGGVRLRWSTYDVTANAGVDYVAANDADAVIAEGADRAQLVVIVNGDEAIEPDETLRVVITALDGAEAGDVEAIGTITNDDFELLPISRIQGAGARSPYAGQTVATRGIVTGRTSRGFFIQSRDVDADADAATSEGLYVFTNAAPPAFATPGRFVAARGPLVEYVPGDDPGQAPLTEMSGAGIVAVPVDEVVYPLPAPVELTATFPSPEGPLDQLERVESMRVIVRDFVATAPTDGSKNEAQATSTGNGLFFGTVAGLPRPFREPGIQTPDAPPAGSIPPIPQWDFNPELLSVDSDALGLPALDVATGTRIANIAGPLNYSYRRWQILPDSIGAVTPGASPRAVAPAPADAFSVAGYNMERFFDEVDDPGKSDVRLSAAALERRLSKASLGIRDFLRLPDILGVVEMENLAILQRVADRVNGDAVVAGQGNPAYAAYLIEGNDVGGIDVGFLVKTADVAGGRPRVEVVAVEQVGKDTTWQTPDGQTQQLNDRPPLALSAVVHYADGRAFPLTVVIAHQRSLLGAETADAEGARIRIKRQRQAEFLAAWLDARQKRAPDTRLVVLGDFNAFEFNDGLVDAMGTVTGKPSPDEQTAVEGDGADLVEPNLVNLTDVSPREERYSFTFDGNAQTLDHVLVNEDMVVATRDIRLEHARVNADFPEINRNDASSPSRLADHDPVVAYFLPRRRADLGVTATAATFVPGQPMRFEARLRNAGPEQADFPEIGFELDAELPDLSVTAPAGWTCAPNVVAGGRTSVDCRADALAVDANAAFVLAAMPTPALRGRPLLLVAAADARSLDPDRSNNAAGAQQSITQKADLAVALAGVPLAISGRQSAFVATVTNLGPQTAIAPRLVVTGNAPAASVTTSAPSGWRCSVVAADGGFRATCDGSTQVAASLRPVTLRLVPSTGRNAGELVVRAQVSSASADPVSRNDAAGYKAVVIPLPR